MEAFFVLLIIAIFLAPFFMALAALLKVSALRREIESLRAPSAPPQEKVTEPQPQPVVSAPATTPPPRPPPTPKAQANPVISKPKHNGMEFLLGGKGAAFIGAGILVMGIAFLVGYAIQHSLIGPGARVILGLLSGGVLVAVGYGLEVRGGGKYGVLARTLTGAGSSLFYFVVFAAYGIYHLISPFTAGAGLLACALAVFGLSMVYQSQSVAVLGVLGAFVTPLLIGGDFDSGVFALSYIAVINIPVFLLGLRRRWQVLYNLAFVFTIVYFVVWLDWMGKGEYATGLLFAGIFFAEYAALGLLKLRAEQQIFGRRLDSLRLISASALLLWAVYWMLEQAGWMVWVGAVFVLLALIHISLAALARRLLSNYTEDILAFLGGGLFFAVMALPAQLDGAWVSLGWAIEGAVLCWFATRVQSRTLLATAAGIGGIGIIKALGYDFTLYEVAPHAFLNARFASGLAACGLLGAQAWLAKEFKEQSEPMNYWRDGLCWIGILAALLTFGSDAFWTLGVYDEWAWVLITTMLLFSGGIISLVMPSRNSTLPILGRLLLALLPLQIVFFYFLLEVESSFFLWRPYTHPAPWILLAALGAVVLVLQPRLAKAPHTGPLADPTYGLTLSIASLVSALIVITLETDRLQTEWSGPLITFLWAVSALALIVYGLLRRTRAYRIFGLILFALTILKVLLFDSSELDGLERIAAFIGTGLLLLVLSFVYQKAASKFLSPGESV